MVNCPKLERMVLVGDTKQLGVFTYIREDGVTADVKSLMLRLEEDGFSSHLLSIQYRMPPALANVVSLSSTTASLLRALRLVLMRHTLLLHRCPRRREA